MKASDLLRMAKAAPSNGQDLTTWLVMRAVNHLEMELLDRAVNGVSSLTIWTFASRSDLGHYVHNWRTLFPGCGVTPLFVHDGYASLSRVALGPLTLQSVNALFDLTTKMAMALLIEDGYQLLLLLDDDDFSLVLSCAAAE